MGPEIGFGIELALGNPERLTSGKFGVFGIDGNESSAQGPQCYATFSTVWPRPSAA